MSARRKGMNATGLMAPPLAPQQIGPSQQLPPPSSIAAILNFQKAADGTQRLSDRDVFQQLLAEILGPEGGEPSDSAGLEDDLAVNYKLIQVVTSAGLSILLQDDPFASSDELIHQASNSLLVVRLTIQRTPQVLFRSPPADKGSQTDPPVLFHWLLPRLLPLLGHKATEKLVEELLETLEAVFIAAARIPEAWKYLRTLLGYFRSCVNCISTSFSTTAKITAVINKSFKIDLPGDDFLNDPVILKQIPDLTPQTLQFTVKDPEHAAFIAVHLFSVLFGLVPSSRNMPVLRNTCDNMAWMLQEMSKLWTSLHIWESLPAFHQKIDAIRLKVLQALNKALEQVPSSQYQSMKFESLCLLTVNCASETLKEPVKNINQLVEHALADIVVSLVYMAEKSPPIAELLLEHIVPLVTNIMMDGDNWTLLHHDLKISILRLLIGLSEEPTVVANANTILQSISEGKWIAQDSKLQEKLEKLRLISIQSPIDNLNTHGPRKRIRLTVAPHPREQSTETHILASEVYRLLGNQEVNDLAGLSLVASDGFSKLSELDRCRAIKNLGLLSCAFAESLSTTSSTKDWGPYRCAYCDAEDRNLSTPRKYGNSENSELFKTLEVLLKLDSFQESTKVRVWGVMSLKRLLNHTQDLTHLNLTETGLGKWCVHALQSSRRELRIAAGRTMPAFVSFSHDMQVLKANRFMIIEFLRSLSGGDELSIQETCVLAWSQLARVLSNEVLNLALIQLVEYLGHGNSFIIGVAYNELQSLAQHHECTPKQLLSPFWRNISVGVVKQLQSKPQIAQLLSELLGIDVPGFLRMTKSYTLPYLILWKRNDLIERVAQASAQNCSVLDVCLDNMPLILALLLIQDFDDVEKTSMALLEDASSEFKTINFTELVRSESISIAAELLKALGDEAEGEEKKMRIYNALDLVAHVSHKKLGKAKAKEKKINCLDVFFEANILGIFAQFNDTLKDGRNPSMPEKIRSLRAIEEMVKLAKGCVSNALPQICASLQSALEVEKLRTCALYTWATLMTTLPEDDIGPLLGPTFSVLLQCWEELNDSAKDRAQEMVTQLFAEHPAQIQVWAGTIPSLASVPLLSKFAGEISKWKEPLNIRDRFQSLVRRCRHENVAVVEQALVELVDFIQVNQDFIHTAAISDQPEPGIPELIRCLLDVIIAFKDSKSASKTKVEQLCAECLGLIGAVDPNRVEAPREKRDIMVLHNFERADESVEFVVFFLEERIVKAFLSATDTCAQGFLAFGMQEFLKFCDVDPGVVLRQRPDGQGKAIGQQRWASFSQTARNVLTPFLKSKYFLASNVTAQKCIYPVFSSKISHRQWLQTLLLDLLSKPNGDNAANIFSVCSKIVKDQDISISNFLLPFVTLNVVISGTDMDRKNIESELLGVLRHAEEMDSPAAVDTLRQCSETVFLLVDHLTRWLRDKKKYNSNLRVMQARQQNRHAPLDDDGGEDIAVKRVEALLSVIPPDIMGLRSYECNSYARALFYWEQHIRQTREHTEEDQMEPLYQKLQHIYTQIDEPDGIEGISTKLHVLDMDQQMLEHRKAGRWTAAQSWYELLLSEKPGDVEIQTNLLTCLKESGQHEMLLNKVDEMIKDSPISHSRLLGYAVEASWISGKWDALDNYLAKSNENTEAAYEIRIGRALSALRGSDMETFSKVVKCAREDVVNGLTESFTGSLRQCHDSMVKLHSLVELEVISSMMQRVDFNPAKLEAILDRRLEVMGTYSKDKQYVLALRRATFQLTSPVAMKDNIASAWLTSAQLARKAGQIQQSFNAVLHASRLGKQLATVEHAKLLWHEGQHRKAIQNLEGAIASGLFQDDTAAPLHDSEMTTVGGKQEKKQDYVLAKASLLLARWLDGAGQTHSTEIVAKYNIAAKSHYKWEQGHYFLGRHYNKLYEAEKALPPAKQTQQFLNGETAKLVCKSYLRALSHGAKYIFQTMPRLLTLWLDLGELVDQEVDASYGSTEFRGYVQNQRNKNLSALNTSIKKHGERLPSWMYFTVFPQIMSRIVHPHENVYKSLQAIIVKVVCKYPQQALWSLMAVCKSTSKDRSQRGMRIVQQVKGNLDGSKENNGLGVRALINQSQKLTEQLLHLCNADLPGKNLSISLAKDLQFKHNVAPCSLVVPLQSVLTVTLPSTQADSEKLMGHIPFPSHQPTVASFLDEADVMTSLQKPRKIKIRGSDGNLYTFLCKPKDDLRKDARLMEFNNMINRFLKKDAESSRRRLYIRTYFVTPLNEECGLIEWVNNVRPLRDILLKSYRAKRVNINYVELRELLDKACSDPSKTSIFTNVVLPKFPPVFHEWFVEMFSEPSAWFASRLAFSKTCAVMSMVGFVLGLGDRHGENILFDETSGDTLHVDFNCLFDKGLSFDKPEKVPFRLTHNMVDALGVAGYEGVFRRTCEVTVRVLRNNEDTLMTVLETFLHDPAVDMVKRRRTGVRIPDTPKAVLETIQNKLRGLFAGETVPLSVEGQVQELIRNAVSPENLCAMYIGWCAFF